MRNSFAVPIAEATQVGEARRLTASLAESSSLNEVERGKLALVVTELGNNLAKYAENGQLIVRILEEESRGGVEVLSLDTGPGIVNIQQCLTDGYSSQGTPGTGLGAVLRLSGEFDIYSVLGQGTVIVSRVLPESGHGAAVRTMDIGVVCLPIDGEIACGDQWSVKQVENHLYLTVIDGLGHGPVAAEAANEAKRIFHETSRTSTVEILQAAHGALRATRGAVMAVAEVNSAQKMVSYAGIGNISGAVVQSETVHHMVSLNGTVGQVIPTLRSYSYEWPEDGVLIMTSDGIRTQWRLDKYPGLINKHPSVIAGVLFRDFERGRDDSTVLAARWRKS